MIIGKLGEVTYQRWRNKLVVKQNAVSILNPHSDRQNIERQANATAGQNWNAALSDAQRAMWETYANNTDDKERIPHGVRHITPGTRTLPYGHNAYSAVNTRLSTCGFYAVTEPPLAMALPSAPFVTSAVWNEGNFAIDIVWSADYSAPPDTAVRVWVRSQQGLFHKQQALYGPYDDFAISLAEVRGALGVLLPLTDFRESKVYLQCDSVAPYGAVSAGSRTFLVDIPVAP
jgi:hypothetical protein